MSYITKEFNIRFFHKKVFNNVTMYFTMKTNVKNIFLPDMIIIEFEYIFLLRHDSH